MRKIDLIVIHCTATREDKSLSPAELDRMHRQRGFNGCGYHYYVRRDGEICSMRPVGQAGAHAKGHNANSIGIAYDAIVTPVSEAVTNAAIASVLFIIAWDAV